ncbi:hypothetical protein J1N09_03925 [Aureitalea sp. L0-47]|uniref:hypothetical protein n=1 Tax=Aureitalea sp. L0-47 TaxID=2816962 RepID=UPI0022371743|nr:hypothetical protein [Aureitalea sp. L0-47]MCW5518972.1 hypothetical protein [Aureitalea sp. L0-47]
MEELISRAEEAINCSQCDTIIATDKIFCVSCGFPERGTESEKSKFHADRVLNQRKQQFAKKELKTGRIILLVIAGISFLSGLFYFFVMDDSATLIASGILSIVYLALAYWSQQKPLIAMVLGLLVYLTTLVINAIVDPETIYRGIIMKALIIGFLGKGINSALQLRKNQ